MNPKDKSITKEEAKKLLMGEDNRKKEIEKMHKELGGAKSSEDSIWIVSDSSSGFSNLSLKNAKLD